MRYLFIALLIVLLPLRGWAGNAMAVDMAVQQVLMAQTSVANTAVMPADCPMHMQALDNQTGAAKLNCNSCDTCELCLALASWTHTVWAAGKMSRPAAPLLMANDFRSAAATASFKPPIS